MGMNTSIRPLALADVLFFSTQQRVLGLIFGQPERSFFATEIIDLLAEAEQAFGRPINLTLYTRKEFQRRLSNGSPFLGRVLAGNTLVLQGSLPLEES